MILEIDKRNKRTYAVQIYRQIRTKILNGEIAAGERLPASRVLADEVGVSRNTVVNAYEMLIAEGFAYSITGSGVYVLQGAILSEERKIANYTVDAFAVEDVDATAIRFDSGTPALEFFPRAKWKKYLSQAYLQAPISALGYDLPQGRPELRSVLARHLKKTRGISCDSEQILITSGTKQGLNLLAKVLIGQGDEVLIEEVTNDNVRRIFAYHTDRITPVELDAEGIRTDKLPPDALPSLIFVTPMHQFPMGGTLSIQRRLELVRYAQEKGCYIAEDDYDSEFCYTGFPPRSLYELDAERVIYIGTFSKTMFPSLRLGYLVLPPALAERFREMKRLNDHHSNSMNQLALMRFIESGDLARHIGRMKKRYKDRRDTLLSLLTKYFPQNKTVGEKAGMHVVSAFPGVNFEEKLLDKIRAAGVYVIPVEAHTLVKGNHRDELILGYAHLDEEAMEQGLKIIKDILTENE